MKLSVALIALALPILSLPVNASEDLAKNNKCMVCHKVDAKGMGPSFKDISAKYKGDKTAEAMLGDSILKGVKGKWGKIPMPPQKIAPEDAQKLSAWILSL